MNTCKTCENAVYDERWREYRCKVYQHRIRDVDKYIGCPSHEEKKKPNKKVKEGK